MEKTVPTPPKLNTSRMTLRALEEKDLQALVSLINHPEIADTTLTIPHPYSISDATEWLNMSKDGWREGTLLSLGLFGNEKGDLLGGMGLSISPTHAHAELGYWIGTPYWGNGYCTEAARAVLQFAFENMALHRVFAHHFTRNPASCRVMEKCGMEKEGFFKGHIRKKGAFEDLCQHGILNPYGS